MRLYGDRVHFVVINVVEPHPFDEPSPYSPNFPPYYWASYDIYESTVPPALPDPIRGLGQPKTYDERRDQAIRMKAELRVSPPVLVDEMDNPVWCTYGPLPNCAYLIGKDGIVYEKESWYHPGQSWADKANPPVQYNMEKAIKAYFGLD